VFCFCKQQHTHTPARKRDRESGGSFGNFTPFTYTANVRVLKAFRIAHTTSCTANESLSSLFSFSRFNLTCGRQHAKLWLYAKQSVSQSVSYYMPQTFIFQQRININLCSVFTLLFFFCFFFLAFPFPSVSLLSSHSFCVLAYENLSIFKLWLYLRWAFV